MIIIELFFIGFFAIIIIYVLLNIAAFIVAIASLFERDERSVKTTPREKATRNYNALYRMTRIAQRNFTCSELKSFNQVGRRAHCTFEKLLDGTTFDMDITLNGLDEFLRVGDYYTGSFAYSPSNENVFNYNQTIKENVAIIDTWYASANDGKKKFKKDQKKFKKSVKKLGSMLKVAKFKKWI